jgi:hypothetical protein
MLRAAGVFFLLALSWFAGRPCPAQSVCATINPTLVFAGNPITITVRDATGQGFSHLANCVATTIHSAQPNGPVVNLPSATCGAALTPVPAFGTASKTQNLPSSLAPGLYYWKVEYAPGASTTLVAEWFAFTVDSGIDPFLFPQTTAQVGQSFVMDLTHVFGAFRPYVVAASLTTNSGMNFGGLFVSLDPDPVFMLSFPSPDPVLFTNFQGVLGISGTAFGVSINIPPVPALANLPLHVQGAVGRGPGLAPLLTNVLNVCIAP